MIFVPACLGVGCSIFESFRDYPADASARGADAKLGDSHVEAPEAGVDTGNECAPSGSGAVGTLGCPCASAGDLACNGNAQKVSLICSAGTWRQEGPTCPMGQLCDTQGALNHGTCQPIDPTCAHATPGQNVCSSATTAVECGPDLVSETPSMSCLQPAPLCNAGACACPTGYTVANGACCPAAQTGCGGSCVDERTDKAHCGACGLACTNPQGTTSCAGGVCTPVCKAGFAVCAGPPKGGCEVDTMTDPNHCGACGTVCSNAHGTTTCASGVCNPICNPDFFDCDGNPDNGCETAFIDDGTCVACGHHCTGTLTCESNGECACLSNADCNGGTLGNCDGFGICSCFDTGSTACAVGQRCDTVGACDWVGP